MVPLDRLLIETDSPFLAPVPHRGNAQRAGACRARRRGDRRAARHERRGDHGGDGRELRASVRPVTPSENTN